MNKEITTRKTKIVNNDTGEISYLQNWSIINEETKKVKLSKYNRKSYRNHQKYYFHLKTQFHEDLQNTYNLNLVEIGRLMYLFTFASYQSVTDFESKHYLQHKNGKYIKTKELIELFNISERSAKEFINKLIKYEILHKDNDIYYFNEKYISRGSIHHATKKVISHYRIYISEIRELYEILNNSNSRNSKYLGLLTCMIPFIKLLDNEDKKHNRKASNNILVLSEYDYINNRYEAISQKHLAERLNLSEKSLIKYFKELNNILYNHKKQFVIYKYQTSLQAFGQRYKYTNEAIVLNPNFVFGSDEKSIEYLVLKNKVANSENQYIDLLDTSTIDLSDFAQTS